MDKKGFNHYALLCMFTITWFLLVIFSVVGFSMGFLQILTEGASFNDMALCFFFGILAGGIAAFTFKFVLGVWTNFR